MGQTLDLPRAPGWGQHTKDDDGSEDRMIRDLVERKEWSRIVELLLEAGPSYAGRRHPHTNKLPIHWALMRQAPYEVVSCLLSQYPEAISENDSEESRRKPLHLAAQYYSKDSRPQVLETILAASPEMAAIGDEDWSLPLHIASSCRASRESVRLLLDAHPDGASRRTKAMKLPLHLACEYRASLDSTKELLDAFPAGAKESSMLRYPLHFACEFKGSIEVVATLLQSYPEAAFARAGSDTLLPLHLACANKARPDVIELLLQYNAEGVVDRDNNMRLPIHHAIERNACEETVILLVKTCPETAAVMGFLPHLPLHIALEKNYSVAVVDALLEALPGSSQKKDAYGIFPLHRAIKSRASPEVVLSLLRDDKLKAATMEFDEYERLTLHYACARSMPLAVILALVEAFPASVQVPDKNGQLPLHLSVMRCADLQIIELLVKTFPAAVMTRDNYSYLPLHHAVEVGASEGIFELLIKSDRGCTELRVDGRLPLHFAIETKRSPVIISMLLNAYPIAAREPEHEKGRIALQHAIERRHSSQVLLELMSLYPQECSMVKDYSGRLAAHYCVEHDAPIDVFKQILKDNPGVVLLKELPFYYYEPTESGKVTGGGVTRPTKRRPGKQLIHYATEDMHANSHIAEEILMVSDGGLVMPISASSGMVNLHHGHGWTYLLSECNDKYSETVERILDRYSLNIKWVQTLCDAPDELGRPATQVATADCRRLLMKRLHFFGRYEFFPGPITHESENSLVRFATDHGAIDGKRTVVLKFMKHKDQFEREINLRTRVKLSEDFVVPALSSHDSNSDPEYLAETRRKGFGDYPYCVATAAAERDLNSIIQREHISGYDYSRIRQAALHILQGLDHFHNLNLIHGDVKPMNVVRVGGRFKFIDLGASVFFGSFAGASKVSSAYMPPEMVFIASAKFEHQHANDTEQQHTSDALSPPLTVHDKSAPLTYTLSSQTGMPTTGDKGDQVVECIPADMKIDMWSFGVLFFFLCSGETLFPCTVEDKLDATALAALADWNDDLKFQRLAKVSDPLARNLILQLLSKDPNRRPNARDALKHPFFTHAVEDATTSSSIDLPFRFQGMTSKFDVCICFRALTDRMRTRNRVANRGVVDDVAIDNEDGESAQLLAKKLADEGLKVCFSDGGVGLINSKACCIILSRAAINNEHDVTRNFCLLDNEATEIDDMFMDVRLAIELTHHGLLEGGVYAVLVGDKVDVKTSCCAAPEEDPPPDSAAVEEKSSSAILGAPLLPGAEDRGNVSRVEFAPYYATHDGEMLGRWGGSHPLQLCNESIDLVERRMSSLLQNYCLGACPILNQDRASVAAIMHSLVSCTNIFVVGDAATAWEMAVVDILQELQAGGDYDSVAADANTTEGEGIDGNQSIKQAKLALLGEKVLAKEREIELLNATIEKERLQLEMSKKQLQNIRYKYSIFE